MTHQWRVFKQGRRLHHQALKQTQIAVPTGKTEIKYTMLLLQSDWADVTSYTTSIVLKQTRAKWKIRAKQI
jgi:hypothetical protein